MKHVIPFLILLAGLFATASATAQLDVVHWVPPLHSQDNGQINDHYLYLSTPETSPVTVNLYDGSGATFGDSPYTISNGSPVAIEIGNGQGVWTDQRLVLRPGYQGRRHCLDQRRLERVQFWKQLCVLHLGRGCIRSWRRSAGLHGGCGNGCGHFSAGCAEFRAPWGGNFVLRHRHHAVARCTGQNRCTNPRSAQQRHPSVACRELLYQDGRAQTRAIHGAVIS